MHPIVLANSAATMTPLPEALGKALGVGLFGLKSAVMPWFPLCLLATAKASSNVPTPAEAITPVDSEDYDPGHSELVNRPKTENHRLITEN